MRLQATINRPVSAILFFWRAPFRARECVSFLRLRAEFQSTVLCCTGNLFLPIKHFIDGVSGGIKWVNQARGWGCCSPAKYLNWFRTLIVTKRECPSDVSSVEGGTESVPGVSQPQPYHQTARSHESSSSISSSASDKEDAGENGPGKQTQQPITLQLTRPSCLQNSVAHTYTGGPRGKEDNEASHINDGSSPLSIFLLYFADVTSLLVVKTNSYYHDYIDLTMDPLLNLTLLKPKCLFLASTLQTGHGVRDKLTD